MARVRERLRAATGGRRGLVGDRYFIDTYLLDAVGKYSWRGVLTAVLNSDSAPVRLLDRARNIDSDGLWVGTPKALFWSDGSRIYSRSFDPEL